MSEDTSVKGSVKIDVVVKVYDKNGKLLKTCEMANKTPLTNLLKVLRRAVDPEPTSMPISDISGTTTYLYRYASTSACTYISTGFNQYQLRFGSGTTPVARSDYSLESEIANFAPTYYSVVSNTDTEFKYKISGSYVWSAGGTISEVGISIVLRHGTVETTVLIDRTVLDVPVDVPAGGVVAIEYTVGVSIT